MAKILGEILQIRSQSIIAPEAATMITCHLSAEKTPWDTLIQTISPQILHNKGSPMETSLYPTKARVKAEYDYFRQQTVVPPESKTFDKSRPAQLVRCILWSALLA